jgi:hypothetical protein
MFIIKNRKKDLNKSKLMLRKTLNSKKMISYKPKNMKSKNLRTNLQSQNKDMSIS